MRVQPPAHSFTRNTNAPIVYQQSTRAQGDVRGFRFEFYQEDTYEV